MHDCNLCESRLPDLLPENRDAWWLWTLANTQWRLQGLVPVGLDFPAVFQIAEVNLIEVIPALFQKLKLLEACWLSKVRQEEEGKSEAAY